jgi:hypothetical protein
MSNYSILFPDSSLIPENCPQFSRDTLGVRNQPLHFVKTPHGGIPASGAGCLTEIKISAKAVFHQRRTLAIFTPNLPPVVWD